MGFLGGSVSYSRFRVVGGSPKRLDENLIEKLRAHAVGKQPVMRSDREEVGWTGGRHLLDRDLDVEKNVILDCLHLGMRIDSSKVPPELMRAYLQMELDSLRAHGRDENNAQDGKSRGFAKLKKQAADAAKARVETEVKEGRFRSQRAFPVLLDTRNDVFYLGSTSPAVVERLQRLFRETFDKRLEPLTAGQAGYQWAERSGASRRVESLQPARFVTQPDGNGHAEVWWSTKDPASRDYLGNEFLLWLWYTLTEESDTLTLEDQSEAAVVIVKQLTLECPWAQFGKVDIAADGPSRLRESREAIATGKLPRKIGLIVTRQEEQYEFTLSAETLAVSGAVLPALDESGTSRVEERVEQIRHLAATIDAIYHAFLAKRLTTGWESELEKMRNWLREGQIPKALNTRAKMEAALTS
jgi:hypothetical protein